MTEERLKEIKDSIDCGKTGAKLQALKNAEVVYDQELELYNEVVRLREIINKAKEYNKELCKIYDICSIERSNADTNLIILENKEHLDILKQYNLTLEQLGGIENE